MQNSLKFGTSGLRGLATDLAGTQTRRYVSAFLHYLDHLGERVPALYIGRDLRPSSQAMMTDCAAAAAAIGIKAIDCGVLPTPALALHAMAAGAPSVMITGSHIPADRNGLKFYTRRGEISKADEAGITVHLGDAAPGRYDASIADEAARARQRYADRYAGILKSDALKGKRIGLYEHSTVGRDLLAEVFAGYGAEIVRLGRVDEFVAVDTEAFSDPVFAPLPGWIGEYELDAIVSADGDADRPLLMDEKARFVRGDVLGLLASRFFGADAVVTPVTSNTGIEATRYFSAVVRTRVGSPFVIEGMKTATAKGANRVMGFEANGGTLLGSPLTVNGKHLPPLMTRDAILPLVGLFGLMVREDTSLSALVDALPLRTALSDRLADVSAKKSGAFLDGLRRPDYAEAFFRPHRGIVRTADIDGLQFWLVDGTMMHYRASGNAPELRCYVEADTPRDAERALAWGKEAARRALDANEERAIG